MGETLEKIDEFFKDHRNQLNYIFGLIDFIASMHKPENRMQEPASTSPSKICLANNMHQKWHHFLHRFLLTNHFNVIVYTHITVPVLYSVDCKTGGAPYKGKTSKRQKISVSKLYDEKSEISWRLT